MTIIPDVGLRVLRALTLQDLESLTSRDPLLADLPVEEFAAAVLESTREGRVRAARRPLRRPLAARTAHGPAPEPAPPAAAHGPPVETGTAAPLTPSLEAAAMPLVATPVEPAAAPEPPEEVPAAAQPMPSPKVTATPLVAGAAAPPTAAESLVLAESAFAQGDYPAAARLCEAHLESYYRPHADGGRKGAALLLKALRLRAEPPATSEHSPPAETVAGPAPARTQGSVRPCVILVGGLGRMADEYERLFDSEGCDLIFVENTPRGLRGDPRASGIIVVTSNVSHPLRELAVEVATRADCPIHYIDRPSLSGIRGKLREILGESGVP